MASPTFALPTPSPDADFYRKMAARQYLNRRQAGSINTSFPGMAPPIVAAPGSPPFRPAPTFAAPATPAPTVAAPAPVPTVAVPGRPYQPPPGQRGHANRGGLGGPGVLEREPEAPPAPGVAPGVDPQEKMRRLAARMAQQGGSGMGGSL